MINQGAIAAANIRQAKSICPRQLINLAKNDFKPKGLPRLCRPKAALWRGPKLLKTLPIDLTECVFKG